MINPMVRRTLTGVAVTLPVISSSSLLILARMFPARATRDGGALVLGPVAPGVRRAGAGSGFLGAAGREEEDAGEVGSGIGLEVPFTEEALALRVDGLGSSSTPKSISEGLLL